MTQAGVVRDRSLVADVAVVIPVWQPDRRLGELVSRLLELGFGAIIVVNDGSDSSYDKVFSELSRDPEVHVVRHAVNLGKGRALKTGLDYFKRCFPDYIGAVTADADGQHRPADIFRTAEQLRGEPSRMVLGSRHFTHQVPLRSRLGNLVTSQIFSTLTGRHLTDTQSGLRGIPTGLVSSVLALEGERYEYEMNVLTHLASSSGILEVPIETVYLEGNRSSHFRPITDSIRIYFVLLRFLASSLVAASIDFVVFAAVFAVTSNLLTSIIAGRVSSLANFALNRRFVFNSSAAIPRALAMYYTVAAGVSVVLYFSIKFMAGLGMNVLAAKLLAETVLWFASFSIQRAFVFASKQPVRS
jgi:glycosyltransferase involved in cell wall biosynthesis